MARVEKEQEGAGRSRKHHAAAGRQTLLLSHKKAAEAAAHEFTHAAALEGRGPCTGQS